MPDESPSDHSLLRRFRRGQEDGPTLLYLRYAERLRALATAQMAQGLAARVDSEDIVQSVFRTFFRRAAEGQYDVPEGEELWKLLLVIALNKVRAVGAHHRAARRDVRQTVGGESYDRVLGAEANNDEEELAFLRLVIDEVLAALPSGHRPIVELRIEGHEVAEIAQQVRRSKRTVERILQEFRRRLGAQIHGDG
ncbi:MAG TPA: sigma-70 family RNA polymerase sigma factor [Isosphaeraceae bacterium]|jgi:RNA polymerase sigma-70 factor (ECF subfamily)